MAWIIFNCMVGLSLAVLIKLLSGFRAWRQLPNLLLLGWFVVLFKLALPPLVPVPVFQAVGQTAYFSKGPGQPMEASSSAAPRGDHPAVDDLEQKEGRAIACFPAGKSSSGNQLSPQSAATTDRWASPFGLRATMPISELTELRSLVLLAWFIGVGCFAWMRIRRCRAFSRLLACGSCSPELTACLHRLAGGNLRSLPEVITIEGNFSPALAGLWRRRIVLPAWAARELTSDELAMVLQHELQHDRRRDSWWELLAWMTATAVWWNPCAWWAYRELRTAQELCCDAAVIRRGVKARDYAQTLLRVLDLMQSKGFGPHANVVNMAVLSRTSAGHLERRIMALALPPGSSRLSAGMLFLTLGWVCVAFTYPTLAQHRRLPESFEYEPMVELNDPSAFRELSHQWPVQIDHEVALQGLAEMEVLTRGWADFGASGRPLIMAVVRHREADRFTNGREGQDAIRLLAIDINRDEKLTMDELIEPETIDGKSWRVQISPHPVAEASDGEPPANRTANPLALRSLHDTWLPKYYLQVKLERNRLFIGHAARLVGRIQWQGQSLPAQLVDRDCNGQWTDSEDRLHIDWNLDGRFSPIGERYSCQQEIVRSGVRYSLAFSVDQVTLEPITGTGKVTLVLDSIDKGSQVTELKALLVSRNGIHVTGSQINSPITVPVGEYRLMALSFQVKADQIWHYRFVADPTVAQVAVDIQPNSSQSLELLGRLELAATVVAGRPVAARSIASTEPESDFQSAYGSAATDRSSLSNAGAVDPESHLPAFQTPSVATGSESSASIIQPVLRSATGLFLVRCGFGENAAQMQGVDPAEESRLMGIHLNMSDGKEKVRSLTDTGFACGAFCPIQVPSGADSGDHDIFRLQFDAGPAAGLLSADLEFVDVKP